jgi:hypothetical protein
MGELESERIGKDKVFAALSSIIGSEEFVASPQLAAFLTFSVRQTLEGQGPSLKAYTIATEVLGRSASFDPQNDPIVRVEATRLRRAMDRYYATDGRHDSLKITMPKGGYSVIFEEADQRSAALSSRPAERQYSRERRFSGQSLLVIATSMLAIAGLAGGGWWLWSNHAPDISEPQILSLQLTSDPSLDETKPTNAIAKPKPSWKPRIAAIAIKEDPTTKPFIDDIVNIMIRFDGISIYGEAVLPDPLPEDLYILEGVSRPGNESMVDLRLLHAASSRIVLSHTFAKKSDPDETALMVRKLALEIAGRNGVIRTDALPAASNDQIVSSSAHGCLAMVHVSISSQEAPLLEQARKCLDALLKTSAHSAMLLSISAELRRYEKNGDLGKAADEANLALAMDPKNTTAMQVLSDLLESKNLALSLRMGDIAVDRNPFDPVFLRSQARRLHAAGLIGRADQLLSDADKIE